MADPNRPKAIGNFRTLRKHTITGDASSGPSSQSSTPPGGASNQTRNAGHGSEPVEPSPGSQSLSNKLRRTRARRSRQKSTPNPTLRGTGSAAVAATRSLPVVNSQTGRHAASNVQGGSSGTARPAAGPTPSGQRGPRENRGNETAIQQNTDARAANANNLDAQRRAATYGDLNRDNSWSGSNSRAGSRSNTPSNKYYPYPPPPPGSCF